MGANLTGFDANTVNPSEPFVPLPEGRYLAVITDSEFKPTKRGGGKLLKLTLQVVDGPHKSRKLFANLNLENANADTVRIARADLSAICRAVGVLQPKDSCELHNIPLVVVVGHKKRDDNGALANVIRGYEKKAALAPAPAAASAAGPAPWKR